MAAGLERVRMVAVALEEGPLVIADDVRELRRAERESVGARLVPMNAHYGDQV